MDILQIAITALASMAVLFILTKIMGNRQMSELSMFDHITSITIGSIAAEMATSLEGDYKKPLTAMIIYGLLSILISYVTCKSIVLRRFLEANGKLSIIPIAKERPATPSDLNLSPSQDLPMANVIIDGNILINNLKSTGNNERWLESS